MSSELVRSKIDLLDWRRRVFELYERVRLASDPSGAWEMWRSERDELIRSHPASPVVDGEFPGLQLFDYDPAARVLGELRSVEPRRLSIAGSADESFEASHFADVHFEISGRKASIAAYWLEEYAGGLFVPFRDATAGRETYGAGRYLLDTAKGADLGMDEGKLLLDFNFAYPPSCAYDPMWACPLAPPANRLDFEIRAGEKNLR